MEFIRVLAEDFISRPCTWDRGQGHWSLSSRRLEDEAKWPRGHMTGHNYSMRRRSLTVGLVRVVVTTTVRQLVTAQLGRDAVAGLGTSKTVAPTVAYTPTNTSIRTAVKHDDRISRAAVGMAFQYPSHTHRNPHGNPHTHGTRSKYSITCRPTIPHRQILAVC